MTRVAHQTGVANPLNKFAVLKYPGDDSGVVTLSLNPDLECFQTALQQMAVLCIKAAAMVNTMISYLADQGCRTIHRAAAQITVACITLRRLYLILNIGLFLI